MGRDSQQDSLDTILLVGSFSREDTARRERREPVTQQQIEDRRRRVQEFKDARPGLHSRYIRNLDDTVQSLMDELERQERKRQNRRR